MGSETDQLAIMMGLMLHTNAKQLIKAQNYRDALEMLKMEKEALSLCNPKVIECLIIKMVKSEVLQRLVMHQSVMQKWKANLLKKMH
ncbi:hypothetical protein ABKV19_023285 [Rosa sericea]